MSTFFLCQSERAKGDVPKGTDVIGTKINFVEKNIFLLKNVIDMLYSK